MQRREIIVAYVIAAVTLFAAEAALLLVYGLAVDSESNPFQRISEASSVVGPLVVSWRLAVQMRRVLTDAELLSAAFWCVTTQLIVDVAGTTVAFLAGAFDEIDTSWYTPQLLPGLLQGVLLAAILRYLLLYLIVWVVLRFLGKWLAVGRLRHLDVAA